MTLQAIGAYVGLAVGIFTIYDRVFATKLIRSLVKDVRPQSELIEIWLRNVGKVDAVVTGVTVRPKLYGAAFDNSIAGVVRASVGKKFWCVLRPEDEVRFPLVEMWERDERLADANRYFLIWISWRSANSLWLPHIPLFILAKTDDVRALAKARMPA